MVTKQHGLFGQEFITEMEVFRTAYFSGNPAALIEANKFCAKNAVPPPEWLSEEFDRIVINHFLGKSINKRGRHGAPLTKYKEKLSGYIQVKCYLAVRAWQVEPSEHFEKLPERAKALAEKQEISPEPKTKEAAFKIVHKILQGGPYKCTLGSLRTLVKKEVPKQFEPEEQNSENHEFGKYSFSELVNLEGRSSELDLSLHGWDAEEELFGKEIAEFFKCGFDA